MKLPFALARRFVAGEDFTAAVPKVRGLNAKGIDVTLDLLGENVTRRDMALETTRQYRLLVDEIADSGLQSTISIKLTMLGLDIDRGFCMENLVSLMEKVRERGSFVRIDMEGSAYTQVTIELFKEVFERYPEHVGIVIQAYLHRTAQDIPMLAEMGADVRLCKGAYKEPSSIALQNMADIRTAYRDYARQLLGRTPFPRMATHDSALVEWVKTYAEQHAVPKDRFEFQMLYGLRERTMEDLAGQGYRTRVYVPYGTMWFPYYRRRLTERKENVLFVVSNLFKN